MGGFARGLRGAAAGFLVAATACAGSSTEGGGGSSTSGGTSSSMGVQDAGPPDAGDVPDASAGPPNCDAGQCATSLVVSVNGVTRTLTRAQLGLDGVAADGVPLLYVEAHQGGDPACPGDMSPTPDRTLILANLRAVAGSTQTRADGVRVNLLDFRGDQLTSPAPLGSPDLSVTVDAVDLDGPGEPWVRFTLTATLGDGGVTGAAVATHCASLDG